MLVAALGLQAQTTSRIMLGLGGGLSTGTGNGKMDNICYPMGTFNFGYAIYGRPTDQFKIGLRTGLNATYSKLGLSHKINETFTNTDYYGHKLDYTVTGLAKYQHTQINLELPVMLAMEANGLIINLGTKLIAPIWNKYTQTITDPVVSAYYGDYGVTVVNDPATGVLSNEQCNMSGKSKLPAIMFSLSAELGYSWKLNDRHRLGFDLFVDYVPWSVGASKDNAHKVVEIGDLVNDQFQPKAPVTVNTVVTTNNYLMQYVNAGVKIVWAFDIEK